MYATAHRVTNPKTGATGVNAFLHVHGAHFPWPEDPWTLPERDPGAQVLDNGPQVPPGGNRVEAYLDVLAPDDASADELDAALMGLWLAFVADEAGTPAPQGPIPNPVVYRHGRVVIRFGVALPTALRALELAELRRHVDLAMARWERTPEESRPR